MISRINIDSTYIGFLFMVATVNYAMCKLVRTSIYCFYIVSFIYLIIYIDKEEYFNEINFTYLPLGPGIYYRKRIHNFVEHKEYISKNIFNFTKFNRLKTDIKYILRWSKAVSHYSSAVFTTGQYPFVENNCSNINCFVTNNKGLLGDTRHFDAILFDVENFWDIHPELRSPHQKYIFVASEAAGNYPICSSFFENYYNWTWTYKLNSDIRWSFVTVFNKENKVVGPKEDMSWINYDQMKPISDKVKDSMTNKRKAAAWFVSHCNAKSGRDNVTRALQDALKQFHLTVDIYGWCGNLTCSRDNFRDCLIMLQNNYYFYLSFENSLSEDYVTEKILYPLQYHTVPVVYGGADYGRFLPPGSYLDAKVLNTTDLAKKMHEAITNKTVYFEFFRWLNHYKFRERPAVRDICELCSKLNDPKSMRHSSYADFRKWWLPDFEKKCQL